MPKTIIFDLNGVFIKSEKLSERFEEKFGVKQEEFLPALKEIMAKVRLPHAGDAFRYWKPYLEKWGVTLDRRAFFDFWFNGEKEVKEMVQVARRLKEQGHKIIILSNNFSERAQYYDRHFPFLKEIAGEVYYSWKTGFVKPSKEAYRHILRENELTPEECMYFDDAKENIEAARELGIESHLFKDIEGLKKELKKEFSQEASEPREPKLK